jgi:hypothetical protein
MVYQAAPTMGNALPLAGDCARTALVGEEPLT